MSKSERGERERLLATANRLAAAIGRDFLETEVLNALKGYPVKISWSLAPHSGHAALRIPSSTNCFAAAGTHTEISSRSIRMQIPKGILRRGTEGPARHAEVEAQHVHDAVALSGEPDLRGLDQFRASVIAMSDDGASRWAIGGQNKGRGV